MQAEVIAIGDELTSGQRLDTNSRWLSQQLGEIGIGTRFHTTVGDDLAANMEAFQRAAQRTDVVVATGGLGPTADDLTRQALAQAFHRPLELHEPSLRHIHDLFARFGREMPEQNRIQAMIPRGGLAVANPHGTAPGIDLPVRQGQSVVHIYALPGVPAEMKQMWQETVRPALINLQDEPSVVRHYRLKCFGQGESAIEGMLPDLIRRGREPTVGITASQATITLRIMARGRDDSACLAMMRPTIEMIRTALGELVFGEEDEELQHAVVRLLQQRNETLATCEWGTDGLVARWIRQVAADPPVYAGGLVVADPTSVEHLLGVDTGLEGALHTKALAAALRDRFDVDYGLSIGGWPAAEEDSSVKLYVGLASRQQEVVSGHRVAGHPDIRKTRAAKHAINFLRLHLLSQNPARP